MTESEQQQRIRQLEQELQNIRDDQHRYLVNRAVLAMLNDNDNARMDPDSFCNISGIRFHGNRFVLCGFTDEQTEPGERDAQPVWEALNSTFYYELTALILPPFMEKHICATANHNGLIFCLVNLSDELAPSDYRTEFSALCSRVNDAVEQQEGFRFQVLVSPIGYGLQALPQLRRNVEMLQEYWQLVRDLAPEILFYEDVTCTDPEAKKTLASRQANEQFSDYINRGDFEKAREFFHQEIMAGLLATPAPLTTLRFRVVAMIDYMLQTLTRASRELGLEEVLDEISASELLLNAGSLDEIAAAMDQILGALEARWTVAGTASQHLAIRTRAYIDEHFADCNLNVNQVAAAQGVTASHLTRVFQRCYQMRVLDYIQQVRIRAARDLLSTGLTLQEIADRTGYGSQVNLIRAFRRLEGKTPREFSREHDSGQ